MWMRTRYQWTQSNTYKFNILASHFSALKGQCVSIEVIQTLLHNHYGIFTCNATCTWCLSVIDNHIALMTAWTAKEAFPHKMIMVTNAYQGDKVIYGLSKAFANSM